MPMVWDNDPAIWQLAVEAIAHHGEAAPDFAADMVETLVGRGEQERARTWTRIMKAARVLLETKSSAEDGVH